MKTIVIKICAGVIFKVKWYGSLKFGYPGYLIPLEASVQAGPGTTDLKKRFRNLLQIIKALPECHPADNNFNLFNGCQGGFYAFGSMRAVIYVHAFLPSAYCGFTDPGFLPAWQRRDGDCFEYMLAGQGLWWHFYEGVFSWLPLFVFITTEYTGKHRKKQLHFRVFPCIQWFDLLFGLHGNIPFFHVFPDSCPAKTRLPGRFGFVPS